MRRAPSLHFSPRQARWLLRWALAVLVAGVLAFLVRGADRVPDPELGVATAPTVAQRPPALHTDSTGRRTPLPGFGEVAVVVEPPQGGQLTWCFLAAATAEKRQRGLTGVTDLRGYQGMAFLFDTEAIVGFHMRDTPMPLSIAWIDAAGQFVGRADMTPCPPRPGCPTYRAPAPFRIAIEVPQSRLEELGIGPGATVLTGGPCPA